MIPKKGYVIPRAREVDMTPQIWNGFSETGQGTLKFYPKKIQTIHYFFENRGSTIVYLQKEIEGCGTAILNKFLKNKKFIGHILINHHRLGKRCEKYAWDILKNADTLMTSQLFQKLEQIQKLWITFDQANVSAWFLGSEPLQKHILSKLQQNYRLIPDETETLFFANTLSLTTQEEIASIESALLLKWGKDIRKKIQLLIKKYGWIPYGYDGPIFWDQKFFLKKIKQLSSLPKQQL